MSISGEISGANFIHDFCYQMKNLVFPHSSGELEEIKQDISSFRFEILNQLVQQREEQAKRARYMVDGYA